MITVNGKSYPYKPGCSVLETLSQLGITPDSMVLVMLGGRVVPWAQLGQEIVQDGDKIKLLRIISGG